MDGTSGSNSNNAGPGGQNPPPRSPPPPQQQPILHPGDRSRAIRAELDAKRQEFLERQQRYRPIVHAQMRRVFTPDVQPAWHAQLRLVPGTSYEQFVENALLTLSSSYNRVFTDDQARAVIEHFTAGMNRASVISLQLGAFAGLLAWRGRRTMRFPFYTPARRLPLTSGPAARSGIAAWHGVRFVAYWFSVNLVLKGPLTAWNMMYEKSRLMADPRVWNNNGAAAEQQDGGGGGMGDGGMDGYAGGPYQTGGGEDASPQQSIRDAAQAGWERYKQAGPAQQQQQQRAGGGGGWGSADFDDASPIAAGTPSDSYNNSSGGSAWERLRRQQNPQQQQQQQQQSWQQQPSGQQQSTSRGWGDSGDGVDRAAQDKAQRDFDQMLERDRRGEGQDRGSWSSR